MCKRPADLPPACCLFGSCETHVVQTFSSRNQPAGYWQISRYASPALATTLPQPAPKAYSHYSPAPQKALRNLPGSVVVHQHNSCQKRVESSVFALCSFTTTAEQVEMCRGFLLLFVRDKKKAGSTLVEGEMFPWYLSRFSHYRLFDDEVVKPKAACSWWVIRRTDAEIARAAVHVIV